MPVGKVLPHNGRRVPQRQQGFTYVAVLVAMLILSLATQGVMTYVSQQAQREREADLLRIGQAYAVAVGAYYEATPGNAKRWPRKLEDLIEDRRLVVRKRYLREIYPDPMTRELNWGIIEAPDGGIAGVYSRSDAAPIRSAAMELGHTRLAPAVRYSDWKFVYQPAPVGQSTLPARK